MAKLLLVEDDDSLQPLIADALRRAAFLVDTVGNGADARAYVNSVKYDLLILDWELPDATGPHLCDEFRAKGLNLPILFLTARASYEDKEVGFGSGADDYLTKPFAIAELILRVRALLRRPPLITSKELKARDISLDPVTFAVRKGDKNLNLYPKEFALLEFLMRHPRQIFNVDTLIDRVWATDAEATPETVRVTLMRLRQKLDDNATPLIVTIRGVGYRLDP